MCLIAENKVHIAKEDIICYKMVCKSAIGEEYTTIHYPFRYKNNIIYDNNMSHSEFIEKYPFYKGLAYIKVTKYMFHSYADSKVAREKIDYFPNAIIVMCIIPKGAYYYIGEHELNLSYASSKIKIIEEID